MDQSQDINEKNSESRIARVRKIFTELSMAFPELDLCINSHQVNKVESKTNSKEVNDTENTLYFRNPQGEPFTVPIPEIGSAIDASRDTILTIKALLKRFDA